MQQNYYDKQKHNGNICYKHRFLEFFYPEKAEFNSMTFNA
jgi:hypothetical protein